MTLAILGGLSVCATVWLLALGWLWQLIQWFLYFPSVPDLARPLQTTLPPALPREIAGPDLTVIVPACNEAASIEATLRSLLASRGLRLQILAVDDRSTDATGPIMDAVAATCASQTAGHTLEVLRIRELPTGWLGKPHALALAAERARADWILFTDGDVLFAPDAVALALAYVQVEQADHLVVMPDWITKSHGEAAMHGAMHALSTWTLRLWRVSNPRARDFLGVGAFNLVRRSAYEALGGFAVLRMEVLEDLRLGWMLKRAGYRQRVALGRGLVAVRWAEGAWGVVRNLEKNLFALCRFRVWLTLLAALGLGVQIAVPLAALALGGWAMTGSRAGAIILYAAVAGIYVVSRRVTHVPPGYVLLYPLAASLFLFAILRSMTLALLRRGVVWRGTLYSLKELRASAGRFW